MAGNLSGALLLGFALSLDSLLAGIGLGAGGVRVPLRSALAAGLTGGGVVFASMTAAALAGPLLAEPLCRALGGAALVLTGLCKLAGEPLRRILRARAAQRSAVDAGRLPALLLQPERADADRSLWLSIPESIPLGLALALDGAGAGIGAGLAGAGLLPVSGCCTLLGAAGLYAGARLSGRCGGPLWSAVGGVLLILLGLLRLPFSPFCL